MKAFLSYSLNDHELFVIPLLSGQLREKGFRLTTGHIPKPNTLDYITMQGILTSHLFIGIYTGFGQDNERVYQEWSYAYQNNIPSILLVENIVNLNPELARLPNVVIFNRHQPQFAIQEVNRRMTPTSLDKGPIEKALPWVLGGFAALALIKLLSEE